MSRKMRENEAKRILDQPVHLHMCDVPSGKIIKFIFYLVKTLRCYVVKIT